MNMRPRESKFALQRTSCENNRVLWDPGVRLALGKSS